MHRRILFQKRELNLSKGWSVFLQQLIAE
jgi:hypothetical protein